MQNIRIKQQPATLSSWFRALDFTGYPMKEATRTELRMLRWMVNPLSRPAQKNCRIRRRWRSLLPFSSLLSHPCVRSNHLPGVQRSNRIWSQALVQLLKRCPSKRPTNFEQLDYCLIFRGYEYSALVDIWQLIAALRLIDLGVKKRGGLSLKISLQRSKTSLRSKMAPTRPNPTEIIPNKAERIAAESAPYIVSTFPWLSLDFIISQQMYPSFSFAMFMIQGEHSD